MFNELKEDGERCK